jgi:hypothetical protein
VLDGDRWDQAFTLSSGFVNNGLIQSVLPMNPTLVEANLQSALNSLVGTVRHPGRGRFLLAIDVNERSLSHQLAICLSLHFPDWDIDCEYNRDGVDYPKLLNLPARMRPTASDVDARTVFPDIIVHQRGKSGAENNLLVIEVKKSSNKNQSEFVCDRLKLRQFQTEFGYQNAYLVTLNTDHSLPVAFLIERVSREYVAITPTISRRL